MRVLIVSPYFPPRRGGVENYVYNVAKGLVQRGHSVTVLCGTFGEKSKKELIDGIWVIRQKPHIIVSNTAVKLDLAFAMTKAIKSGHFDLINGHTPLIYYADVAAIVSKICGVPYILTYHNDNVRDYFPLNMFFNAYNYSFTRLTLSLSSRIITASPYCYHQSKILRRFKRKVVWIPPGVDIKKYEPGKSFKPHELYHLSQSSRIVLFVGRITKGDRHKGVDYLIRAFPQVLNKVKDAYLIIAGRGDLIPEYKDLSQSLGILNNVIFTGFVDEDMLIELYQSSDVTVLPSITIAEGFGMSLIEGSACGKPVIASAIGGMKYLVQDGEDGLIVPPKDENTLAEAIISILCNEKLAKNMGIAGRQKAEQYDWEVIVDKTEDVFERVANL